MDIEQQREIELRMYIAEQVAPMIWKAIRRDVIAGVALNGLLRIADTKVEISDQSLHNAELYAGLALSTADALIAKLDKAESSRSETTET